jgi:hypothetical protein
MMPFLPITLAIRVIPYLVRYADLDHNGLADPAEILAALRRVARTLGLAPDAAPLAIAEALDAAAGLPRCGVPDRTQAEDARGYGWSVHDLTCQCAIGAIGGVPDADVRAAYRAALDSWAAVCDLRFGLTEQRTEANIFSLPKNLGGRGGVLAWSYLPSGGGYPPGTIEQRYDSGEPWSQYGVQYLQAVMAHELGHALGLEHGARGSLMQPFAQDGLFAPQAEDIRRIRAIYGEPKTSPTPTPDPDPTPTPEPTPDPGAPPKLPITLARGLTWPGIEGPVQLRVVRDPGR